MTPAPGQWPPAWRALSISPQLWARRAWRVPCRSTLPTGHLNTDRAHLIHRAPRNESPQDRDRASSGCQSSARPTRERRHTTKPQGTWVLGTLSQIRDSCRTGNSSAGRGALRCFESVRPPEGPGVAPPKGDDESAVTEDRAALESPRSPRSSVSLLPPGQGPRAPPPEQSSSSTRWYASSIAAAFGSTSLASSLQAASSNRSPEKGPRIPTVQRRPGESVRGKDQATRCCRRSPRPTPAMRCHAATGDSGSRWLSPNSGPLRRPRSKLNLTEPRHR